MSNIIQFGKYKGKNYEVLLKDPSYVNWLKQKDWINNKYPSLSTYILTMGDTGLPANYNSPTPSHNRLQNKFLSTYYRYNLFKECYDDNIQIDDDKIQIEFEDKFNWDIVLNYKKRNCFCYTTNMFLFCEIKTSVGEEYPCILRKMKQQIHSLENVYYKSNTVLKYCLLIDNLDLSKTTEEDLISIFKYSNIDVVFFSDIEK